MPQVLFIPQEKAYYSEIACMSGGTILCHSLCHLNYKIFCREIKIQKHILFLEKKKKNHLRFLGIIVKVACV